MDKTFYTKTVECPICKEKVEVTKVATSGVRMVKRDEDFCPHYEGTNPLFYNVWICSNCGYAAMEDKFETISDKDVKAIKEKIKSRWVHRDFSGQRTINGAIEAFKLALLNLQVRHARSYEVSKVCLRLAWMYRFLNDAKEKDFLQFSLDEYLETYEKEKLPVDGLDEITCMYMIGEINRRLGNASEAGKWFHKALSFKSDDDKKDNKDNKVTNILNMAREQLQLLKENKESAG